MENYETDDINYNIFRYDLYYFNPIQHGVFWITHTWGGQILPPPSPRNTAILKDMDLKFGKLK